MASGGERYLNWSDFNRACINRGMPPEIFATLKRTFQTYVEGGTDLTTLKWFFNRFAPWSRIITVSTDPTVDVESAGRRKTPPLVLYPSDLLEQGFICEYKPDILWTYGDRGQGKSVFSYGMAERWLEAAKSWTISHEYGPPRVYVYGDVNGYVPCEPGWFRCPDWYVIDRTTSDFPILEVYDEVPLALRSGAVSKAQKKWAEKLTRSRHYNVWTIMNMVQAKMASKRGREMDALTLDRFSGLRQLRERLEDMPVRGFREIYRQLIPEMRRTDPGLAMTQLNEDQGDPGTWLTLYETKPASWLEWREAEKRKRSLSDSGAPWPPECVLMRSRQLAEPYMKWIRDNLDDDEKMEVVKDTLGKLPDGENEEEILERACRHIMRIAKMQWAAIGEILNGYEGAKRERMGGSGNLQRWGHRYHIDNVSDLLKEAGKALRTELPIRNKSPVLSTFGIEVLSVES
jgi:hypothetical protein